MNIISFCKNSYSICDKYAFEIIFVLCIVFLLVFGLYSIFTGKKGSWADKYIYIPNRVSHSVQNDSNKSKPFESKGEKECKRVLEKYFSRPFPKARPDYMNNKVTNFNLELDCFCKELGLAVEYNGKQHYQYIPYFHRNKDAFRCQQYRDVMKRDLCRKNNICLIEVPYTVKKENIEKFLITKLKQHGY